MYNRPRCIFFSRIARIFMRSACRQTAIPKSEIEVDRVRMGTHVCIYAKSACSHVTKCKLNVRAHPKPSEPLDPWYSILRSSARRSSVFR